MHDASLVGPALAAQAGNGDLADAAAQRRLEDQIEWYDGKSRHDQRWFKWLKIIQIMTAAAIPVAASASAPSWLLAAGGGLIVVLEGLQQLQQYQQNWTSYRATRERLVRERQLHAAGAGPYAGAVRPGVLLAERVEAILSHEQGDWVAQQRDAVRPAESAR